MRKWLLPAIVAILLSIMAPFMASADVTPDGSGPDSAIMIPPIGKGPLDAGQHAWFWAQGDGWDSPFSFTLDVLPGDISDIGQVYFNVYWRCDPMLSFTCTGTQSSAFPQLYMIGQGVQTSGSASNVKVYFSRELRTVPYYFEVVNNAVEPITIALGPTGNIFNTAPNSNQTPAWLNPPLPGTVSTFVIPKAFNTVSGFSTTQIDPKAPPPVAIAAPAVTDPTSGLVNDPAAAWDSQRTYITPKIDSVSAQSSLVYRIEIQPPAGYASRGRVQSDPKKVFFSAGGKSANYFLGGKGSSSTVSAGNPLLTGITLNFVGSGVGTIVRVYWSNATYNGIIATTFQKCSSC